MALFGIFCCLLGTFLIVIASRHDLVIKYVVMFWGFIVVVLGVLFILGELWN